MISIKGIYPSPFTLYLLLVNCFQAAVFGSWSFPDVKNSKPIEAIIFDLGGVLAPLSFDRSMETLAAHTGLEAREIYVRLSGDDSIEMFERDEITAEQYRAHLCKLLGADLTHEQFVDGWNSMFLEPLPDIEPLVRRLKRRCRLVVLSNTNRTHAEVWMAMYRDILNHFEKIFVSHEIRARKPEPESFTMVLDYLGLEPARVLFIDDLEVNVEAARTLGIRGVVASNPGEIIRGLKNVGLEFPETLTNT